MARAPTGEKDKLLRALRRCLRSVLKWAEAYEPSREYRQAYEADLDEAEALLVKSDVEHASPANKRQVR